MSNTTMLDENVIKIKMNVGEHLSAIRQEKGYTIEYVANKLHLRARIIELIEANEYQLLPQAVFIKGYLRAYAKLLGVSPEPYLSIFNEQHVEKKPDRALLWQQSRQESHKAEHIVRWFTILFALGVIVAVGMWWQKNREPVHSASSASVDLSLNSLNSLKKNELYEIAEVQATDVSKIQSLLNPKPEMSRLEKTRG